MRRHAAQKLLDVSAVIAEVLPALSGVLQNADRSARSRAAAVVGDLGMKMLATLPSLRAALRTMILTDSDEEVRSTALQALAHLSADTHRSVEALVASLKDPLPYVRMNAAHALGQLGHKAINALPTLTTVLLYDPAPRVKLEAAVAVWRIDRRVVRALPVLIETLQQPDEVSCWVAADCLGEIGPEAAAAIPALQELLQRPFRSRLIHMSIALALERIDPAAAE
jgi:HEAT repeat protein